MLVGTQVDSRIAMLNRSVLNLILKSFSNNLRIILLLILMIVLGKLNQLWCSLRRHFKVVLEKWELKIHLILEWIALFLSHLLGNCQCSAYKTRMRKMFALLKSNKNLKHYQKMLK